MNDLAPMLSREEEAHLQSWYNLRCEGNIPLRLGMYRIKWPKVYRYIVQTDDQAFAIANSRGWIEEDKPLDFSETGIARNLVQLEQLHAEGSVSLALASMGLSILRKAVERNAPDRINLIPEGFGPQC